MTETMHAARTSSATEIARPPRMPLAIRAVNGAAAALRAVGWELVKLDPASVVAEAKKQTGGLDDFGETEFGFYLEGLRRACDSLEREARFTWLGRTIARREMVKCTVNRLNYVNDRKRFPEIAREEIRRPLIVVGMPRTGSTILHDILAQDPTSRAPLTWECMFPSPPPERATSDSDPRIEACEATFKDVDKLIPGFKAMHPMAANLAQECVVLFADAMCTPLFHNEYRVPSFQDWVDTEADWAPVYAFHKAQLQHLQWRCPGERFVLKSGVHMWGLEHLLATYPDACIVQTHRDPVKVVTSFASLATLLRSMGSDRVDAVEVAADWSPRLAKVLDHAIDVRQSGIAAPERFYDMQFPDLLADPMQVVERIYDHFDLELTAEAAARMRRFIDDNPQGKHGKHRYRPEEYGLDIEVERDRYRRYTDHFDIQPESWGHQSGRVRDL